MDSTPAPSRRANGGRSPLYDITNRRNSESLRHLRGRVKRRTYGAPAMATVLGEGLVSANERDAAPRRASLASATQSKRATMVCNDTIPEEEAATAEDPQEDLTNGSTTVFDARSRKRRKTHIGPWQLGDTLGKGSTGMVRLCRHRLTRELAAVKIVSKKSGQVAQAGSIYGIDRWDNTFPERINGEMRIPMAIEREVAILKLIQHRNIMKLYDIWENRKEIYLVLEYVDHGDLFSYISCNGRLSEEGAMHFYRQIMSALSYCHAFNICHRDLKPENILLTSESQVKIADFSMAALHQTSGHRLRTACGSPHYAAPELLNGKKYRGDKADIWSMGIILYAMLAACLPFDDDDLTFMMELVKKGEYDMPEFLSLEAKDLIRRILQVNPDRRISMNEMWRHPLVQKYDYMDDYQPENKLPADVRQEFEHRPFRADEIDPQLVRQLRSLWHMFSEDELKVALMSHEANEQKIFYGLLQKYRERQLENFNPEIVHSRSDYHHLKPSSGWKERRTTCEFANSEGPFRKSVSRFTVISHVAETEKPDQRYDPYNSSSSPPQLWDSPIGSTTSTAHRHQSSRCRRGSTATSRDSRVYRYSTKSAPDSTRGRPKKNRVARLSSIPGTASSLNLTPGGRGRQGSPYVRSAKLRHKRRVDFSQVRASRTQSRASESPRWDVRGGSVYVERNPGVPRPDSGVLPVAGNRASQKPFKKKSCVSSIFKHREREASSHESLWDFSHSLAKDCDEAFGASLITDPSVGASILGMGSPGSPPPTLGFPSSPPPGESCHSSPPSDCEPWLNRPLPPVPLMAGSHTPQRSGPDAQDNRSSKETGKREPSMRDDKSHEKATSQWNRISMPIMTSDADRRIASAPAGPMNERRLASLFSSRAGKRGGVMVAPNDGMGHGRIVSYPSGCLRLADEEQMVADDMPAPSSTVRVVDSLRDLQARPATGYQSVQLEVSGKEKPRQSNTGHQSAQLDAGCQEQQRPQSNAGLQGFQLDAGCQEQQNPQSNALRQSTRLETASQEKKAPQQNALHQSTRIEPAVQEQQSLQSGPATIHWSFQFESGGQEQLSNTLMGRQGSPLEAGSQEQSKSQLKAFGGHQSTRIEAGIQEQKRPQPKGLLGQSIHLEGGSQDQPCSKRHRATGSVSSGGSTSSGAGKNLKKKKSTWFLNKHHESTANGPSGSQVATDQPEAHAPTLGRTVLSSTTNAQQSNWSDSTDPPSLTLPKKRKFGLLFWRTYKAENKMSLAGPEYGDSPSMNPKTEDKKNKRNSQLSWGVDEAAGHRNIEVHHNWLARLFRVKPVTDHLCFAISRKRARQEVTLILRQWRKYGVRDIQVDRERNIIFARVGPKNYLGMKEVALAVEIMAVIEHGNPGKLSIARFTQERGAASTLRRVVGTMKEVFEVRRLLVADKQKAKMMVKTLDA